LVDRPTLSSRPIAQPMGHPWQHPSHQCLPRPCEDDQRNAVSLANKQGREKGREEGALSMQKTIAMNLLSTMDNNAIAQMTGLSLADVEALR
jgi:hypothetical protein